MFRFRCFQFIGSPLTGVALALAMLKALAWAAPNEVTLERTPAEGLQPEVVRSADGTVHLIALVGDPRSADIEYRHRREGEATWSPPIRVNQQPGSALAIGTVRGAQLAVDSTGRAHVIWNGSSIAEPKPTSGGAPLLYASMTEDRRSFTAARNLLGATHDLDGGASVVVLGSQQVAVVWHGAPVGRTGETNRQVYWAASADGGRSFAPERVISPAGMGTCGCCGLSAWASPGGMVSILFRSVEPGGHRDLIWLGSNDGGSTFQERGRDPWVVATCPMSTASFAEGSGRVWGTWETAGEVRLDAVPRWSGETGPRSLGQPKDSKHPRLAVNARGELLVVWTEGTGWQRGGRVAWQRFDRNGKPMEEPNRRDGIPVWGSATAFARADGSFVILY